MVSDAAENLYRSRIFSHLEVVSLLTPNVLQTVSRRSGKSGILGGASMLAGW